MSQLGQENDSRPMRKLQRTDYYEAKSAFEQKQITKFEHCEQCKQEITGQMYRGSKDGSYLCFQCWNER